MILQQRFLDIFMNVGGNLKSQRKVNIELTNHKCLLKMFKLVLKMCYQLFLSLALGV